MSLQSGLTSLSNTHRNVSANRVNAGSLTAAQGRIKQFRLGNDATPDVIVASGAASLYQSTSRVGIGGGGAITLPDATPANTGVSDPAGLIKVFYATNAAATTITPVTGTTPAITFSDTNATATYMWTGDTWQVLSFFTGDVAATTLADVLHATTTVALGQEPTTSVAHPEPTAIEGILATLNLDAATGTLPVRNPSIAGSRGPVGLVAITTGLGVGQPISLQGGAMTGVGTGGAVQIAGGAATLAGVNNGGAVLIDGGATVGGKIGDVVMSTLPVVTRLNTGILPSFPTTVGALFDNGGVIERTKTIAYVATQYVDASRGGAVNGGGNWSLSAPVAGYFNPAINTTDSTSNFAFAQNFSFHLIDGLFNTGANNRYINGPTIKVPWNMPYQNNYKGGTGMFIGGNTAMYDPSTWTGGVFSISNASLNDLRNLSVDTSSRGWMTAPKSGFYRIEMQLSLSRGSFTVNGVETGVPGVWNNLGVTLSGDTGQIGPSNGLDTGLTVTLWRNTTGVGTGTSCQEKRFWMPGLYTSSFWQFSTSFVEYFEQGHRFSTQLQAFSMFSGGGVGPNNDANSVPRISEDPAVTVNAATLTGLPARINYYVMDGNQSQGNVLRVTFMGNAL